MTISQIEVVCAQCGKKFKHRKKLYNSAQAQDYTEWAKDNITICPACWKVNRQTEGKYDGWDNYALV